MTIEAAERRMAVTRLRLTATFVLVAAFWFGVLTEWLQGVLRDPFAMVANSIAWWVLVAFAGGALVRGRGRAAAVGIGAELLLLAGYYLARTLNDVPSSLGTLVFWIGGALVGGAVFGLAGAWWRDGAVWQRVAGLALAGGVFTSEGVERWVLFPWQGATGVIQTVLGVLMVVVLSWTWLPRRRWTVLLALVGATVVGLLGVWGANAVL